MSRYKKKPVVAITGPVRGGWLSWLLLKFLVKNAGGKAFRITANSYNPKTSFDALILGGGADIDPARYKEKIISTIKHESKNVRRINYFFLIPIFLWLLRKIFSLHFATVNEDKRRDDFELRILGRATELDIPVLGICRGAQLINVFFNGSLYQDIKDFYVEKPQLRTALPRVRVHIEHSSRLHKIFNRNFVMVNSLHNQSIKKLGHGLRVSATDSQNIIEAIEHKENRFIVGVQWHPEFLPHIEKQRRLFFTLIKEATNAATLGQSHKF